MAPSLEKRTFLVTDVVPAGDPVTVEGIDPATDREIRDLVLVRGVDLAPDTQESILVTEALAAERGLDLGSTVTLYGAGAPQTVRVIGIVAGDGPVPTPFGRTAWITLDAAQQLFGTDAVTAVDVDLARDVSTDAVVAGLETRLTTDPYVLELPADIADRLRDSTRDIRTTLALIAAVVLFVGAFLIFNTLSMTVVERVREVGLLRAAGATRRQVMGMFLLQALVVGIIGTVVGIALGLALGAIVVAFLRYAEGIRVAGLAVTPMGLAFSVALGILVTAAAAAEPAWRAGRLSPVEALRSRVDPSVGLRAQMRWLIVVAAVVAVGGLVLLPGGLGAGIGLAGPVAVYVLLLATALVSPFVLRPLGRIAAIPFGLLFRTETRLTRDALVRDPGRTALTVGALAIAVAMVVAITTIGSLSRSTAAAWIGDVVPGSTVHHLDPAGRRRGGRRGRPCRGRWRRPRHADRDVRRRLPAGARRRPRTGSPRPRSRVPTCSRTGGSPSSAAIGPRRCPASMRAGRRSSPGASPTGWGSASVTSWGSASAPIHSSWRCATVSSVIKTKPNPMTSPRRSPARLRDAVVTAVEARQRHRSPAERPGAVSAPETAAAGPLYAAAPGSAQNVAIGVTRATPSTAARSSATPSSGPTGRIEVMTVDPGTTSPIHAAGVERDSDRIAVIATTMATSRWRSAPTVSAVRLGSRTSASRVRRVSVRNSHPERDGGDPPEQQRDDERGRGGARRSRPARRARSLRRGPPGRFGPADRDDRPRR